jgi:hypothetical protein
MKLLLCMFGLFASAQALAGEDWELVWVTHDAGWEINKGHGALSRKGDVLEGTLLANDDGRADYKLRVELSGGKTSAMFTVVSENGEASKLTGTYKKWAASAAHCPEQIQLTNDHEYIGLARDTCQH